MDSDRANHRGRRVVGGRLLSGDRHRGTGDRTALTAGNRGADTWRCKECHGWDYQGADGAYGSSSHFTGFSGVLEPASELSHAELLALLDGTANPDHDFSAMGEAPLGSLVIFLSEGLIDVRPFIDPETKAAVGGNEADGISVTSE